VLGCTFFLCLIQLELPYLTAFDQWSRPCVLHLWAYLSTIRVCVKWVPFHLFTNNARDTYNLFTLTRTRKQGFMWVLSSLKFPSQRFGGVKFVAVSVFPGCWFVHPDAVCPGDVPPPAADDRH